MLHNRNGKVLSGQSGNKTLKSGLQVDDSETEAISCDARSGGQ